MVSRRIACAGRAPLECRLVRGKSARRLKVEAERASPWLAQRSIREATSHNEAAATFRDVVREEVWSLVEDVQQNLVVHLRVDGPTSDLQRRIVTVDNARPSRRFHFDVRHALRIGLDFERFEPGPQEGNIIGGLNADVLEFNLDPLVNPARGSPSNSAPVMAM
jgi:hypothetical protein